MTAAEHHDRAVARLEALTDGTGHVDASPEAANEIAAAQVDATLALGLATARVAELLRKQYR